MSKRTAMLVAAAIASAFLSSASATAQEVKHYRFAHDQPAAFNVAALIECP